MNHKNIVFLSYGNRPEYFRAFCSILSFFAWNEDQLSGTRIIVYTDDDGFFKTYLSGFNIEYIVLTTEKIAELKGESDFIHRAKVMVIARTFELYPDDDVIFIDSDTFFHHTPGDIFSAVPADTSLMHKREYDFEEGLEIFTTYDQREFPEAFISYIKDREFTIGGKPEKFSIRDYSWNSGVLGLHKNFGAYMPDVIRMTDQFYANSKWFISEQLAFSLVLDRTTQILPTDHFIYHYWGKRQKLLMDDLIQRFFKSSSPAQLRDVVYMRNLTRKLKRAIEADLVYEQLEIAYSQRHVVFAAKKFIQLLLLKAFNVQVKKQGISVL